jgi:hypothetical protein
MYAGDDTGGVTGWGLEEFVRWFSSRVYEGSDIGVCEGVGSARAAHDHGYDVHLCAGEM